MISSYIHHFEVLEEHSLESATTFLRTMLDILDNVCSHECA